MNSCSNCKHAATSWGGYCRHPLVVLKDDFGKTIVVPTNDVRRNKDHCPLWTAPGAEDTVPEPPAVGINKRLAAAIIIPWAVIGIALYIIYGGQ